MSAFGSWEYWVGVAATLLWLWDIWRRWPLRRSVQSAPLGEVFAAADIADADFDDAVGRLRAEVFRLEAHTRHAAAGTVAAIGGFLAQMNRRPARSLRHFNTVAAVWVDLAADVESGLLRGPDWDDESRRHCSAAAQRCLALPDWRGLVERDLASSDDAVFYSAALAADVMGMDCSALHWQRLLQRPDDTLRWSKVLFEADASRMAAAVTLALQVLPLAQMTGEPDCAAAAAAPQLQDAGLYDRLVVLDLLLQRLQDHPDLGRELLIAGFSSPFRRSRHLAVSAFAAWAPDQRDGELIAALRRAAPGGCDCGLRRHFQTVIADLDQEDAAAPAG